MSVINNKVKEICWGGYGFCTNSYGKYNTVFVTTKMGRWFKNMFFF